MPSETHLLAAWRILAKIVGDQWTVGKVIGGLLAMLGSVFAANDTTRVTLLVLGIVVAFDFITGVRAAQAAGKPVAVVDLNTVVGESVVLSQTSKSRAYIGTADSTHLNNNGHVLAAETLENLFIAAWGAAA